MTETERDPAAQKSFDTSMKSMESGDFKKAHAAFKKFVKEYPKDPDGWFCLAESAYYASGMFGAKIKDEDIAEAYQKAIELDRTRPEFYQSYGQFCLDIGKYDDAESAYNDAADIDESSASQIYSEFAINYYESVMARYGDILDTDPSARIPYAKKALSYMIKALGMTADEAKKLL